MSIYVVYNEFYPGFFELVSVFSLIDLLSILTLTLVLPAQVCEYPLNHIPSTI